MSQIFKPDSAVYEEMRTSVHEGLYLDYDQSQSLIFCLRLFPAFAASIINGAPMTLRFPGPNGKPNQFEVCVCDITDQPATIPKTLPDANGLQECVDHLSQSKPLKVAIFDALVRCVYMVDVKYTLPGQSYQAWLAEMSSAGESSDSYYDITLVPITRPTDGQTPWVFDLDAELNWGNQPYVINNRRTVRHFAVSNFLVDGTVGRWQEQTLRELLSLRFPPNSQLFFNPNKSDATEMIDIALTFANTVALIESKCPATFGNGNPVLRSKQRATSDDAVEAFRQLRAAKEFITKTPQNIEDSALSEQCKQIQNVIQVCVLNMPYLVRESRLSRTFTDWPKNEWPIIMAPATVLQIVAIARSAEDVMYLLRLARDEVRRHNGPPIFGGFAPGSRTG